ncbi:helix-turn-helix domain-containing protein [Streptomonospora nanhaiensis]|uniref:helix-turn-helix domain-containing protein n=1 Tax=Streptomonospora nanhaiensis TaxID=1323731 RepID=UPI001C37F924|nr:helix-turn-helix transcriptional regulator [Streptomonospora nanhaiensis]MBV2366859.1 helix-turn-helix transcriptional regulator [Streptomonospora nanhaiensis]MBX9387649.1 helix-turn-helix transcriptional regulator [Streptomonospora nanhaiensis]
MTPVRRIYLVSAVTRWRDEARITQQQLADAMGWGRAKVQRMESGEVGIKASDVLALGAFYQRDHEEIEALAQIARDAKRNPPHWLPFSDVLPGRFAALEAEASGIDEFLVAAVPGQCQTAAYIRASMAHALVEPEEIERRVQARLTRQAHVIYRDSPPAYRAVLDEAALRRPVGGPAVMRDQIAHLRQLSERVHIQILPFSVGAHAGGTLPFTILSFEGGMGSAVHVEGPGEGTIIEQPETVARHRLKFSRLQDAALSVEDSRNFMAEIAADLDRE